MPKCKVVEKGKRPVLVRSKFKLGGRSSPKAAMQLSNEALLVLIESPASRGRDQQTATQILVKRGVDANAVLTERRIARAAAA